MNVTLRQEFRFEASHRLEHLPPEHPCYQLHGHGYRVIVEVCGKVNTGTGFLIDYADIEKIVQPMIDRLDHSHLNDIDDLPLATTEYIARWLWESIKPTLTELSAITICETPYTCCEYRGE